MVKSFHTLTIRDFSLFEQTGDTRFLIRLDLPLGKLYQKKIIALLDEITRAIGSESDQDQQLAKEHHRLKSLTRIQYLMTLYQAVYNLLMHKATVDVWRSAIGRGKPSDYTNLIYYVNQIEEQTGIIIDPECWEESLFELREKITWMTDKYNEAFAVVEPGSPLTFLQIVLGVFSAMQMSVNEDMRLVTFFELKRQAEQLAIRLKLQADGRQD